MTRALALLRRDAHGCTRQVHHYLLGWFFASCGQFNHPASAALLAVGAGLFVQGAGAYGLDAFFSLKGGCFDTTVVAPALTQIAFSLGCSFDETLISGWEEVGKRSGAGMAHLQVCPQNADTQRALVAARCGLLPLP